MARYHQPDSAETWTKLGILAWYQADLDCTAEGAECVLDDAVMRGLMVPLDDDDRHCEACQADVIGNDPHAEACPFAAALAKAQAQADAAQAYEDGDEVPDHRWAVGDAIYDEQGEYLGDLP